jgi:hypothetical protein
MRLRFPLAMLAALALAFPSNGIYNTVTFSDRGVELYNAKKVRDASGATLFTLADVTYEKNDTVPHITDLTLSFNRGAASLTRDDTGNYRVAYASYMHSKRDGAIGRGAARFFNLDHRVEVETAENQWLGSCGDLGSFTIELRVKPVSFSDASLFSRVGYLSGRRNGIEIALNDGRPVSRMYGIFKNMTGQRVDVVLNRAKRLTENRWHHYSVSYDRATGRLASYLNGEEQEVVYVSENGEPVINTYEPSFQCEDKPIVVVGKNFFGYLDEIRVAQRHIEDLKKQADIAVKRYRRPVTHDRVPSNREGVVTSPVYELPSTGTMVRQFEWKEEAPARTFIWMEFRMSDRLFGAQEDGPQWYRIANGQRNIFLKKTPDGDFLRGRYYQWRAHLIPSPEGSRSPSLGAVTMNYELDIPPHAPPGLEAVQSDTSLRLRWKKNVDADILGYRIYYGTAPGKYEGVISTVNGQRIAGASGGYVSVDLTNGVIEENSLLDRHRVLTYPLLKNNVLYFFSVSAYDSYKPGTPFNHESKRSGEVAARPYGGSDIDRNRP